jgi:hypothetical protein
MDWDVFKRPVCAAARGHTTARQLRELGGTGGRFDDETALDVIAPPHHRSLLTAALCPCAVVGAVSPVERERWCYRALVGRGRRGQSNEPAPAVRGWLDGHTSMQGKYSRASNRRSTACMMRRLYCGCKGLCSPGSELGTCKQPNGRAVKCFHTISVAVSSRACALQYSIVLHRSSHIQIRQPGGQQAHACTSMPRAA